MKIEIKKNKILEILNNVVELIPIANYINLLTGVLIKISKKNIKIIGNSGNSYIEKTINDLDGINIIEEGKALVKAKLLLDSIERIKDEKITIQTIENLLIIKDENTNFELNLLELDDYHEIPIVIPNEKEFSFLGSDVKKWFKNSIITTNFFSENSLFKSININNKSDSINILSTDGYRITNINTEYKINKKLDLYISINTVKEILKVINDQEVIFYLIPNNLIIENDDFIFITKIKSKIMRELSNVLNKTYHNNLLVNKEEFLENLITTALIKETSNLSLELKISKNNINLTTKATNIGKIDTKLKILSNSLNDVMLLVLNHKYLFEAIKSIDDETIHIDINDNNNPIKIIGNKNKSNQVILLPLILRN